jgi:hypothetical protein
MQPLGRKKIQMPEAKHKPKEKGKHITGWWENIVTLSKKRARREAKEQILKEA